MVLAIPLWLGYAASVTFGLIAGSFANVVIWRLPRNESVVKPGSHCPACQTPVRWFDNLPLLSYLLLKGRCRNCKASISARYPVVEFLTALLFLASCVKYGWSPLLWIRDWPFLTMLVIVTFIDLDHRIIPDSISLGGLVLGLVTSFFTPELGWMGSILGATIGFLLFYLLALAYEKSSGREGLGGGDIKFLAMLGAFLGLNGVFATILVSSLAGSVIGILWAWKNKEKDILKSSLPYGPFLVLGGLYYYFLGNELWLPFMKLM